MKPANVCRHLRTKKMYIPAQADEVFSATGEAAADAPAIAGATARLPKSASMINWPACRTAILRVRVSKSESCL